ncbi:SDR family oxidoreductase [Bradyrhizobium sp. LMG 9283]|uniref:SDR family oxidoreductase n=1 Tax=Bradyrhizobium sp. LMG 9283 TaxID=592064 RepID=UPI00388EFBA2
MNEGKRVAIVTAASQGLGEAIARRLAADGYELALFARSEKVEILAAELNALPMRGSLTDPHDLQRLVSTTMDRFGRIDALVCSTGVPAKGELLAIDSETWHRALDLVLLQAVRLSSLVTPPMVAQGGGAIVNISSCNVREPSVLYPVGSVMRAGLSAFAKLYVEKNAQCGIRMNNLLPGYFENYEQPAERVASIPAKRLGKLSEIAGSAAFLLSADAGYINGQDILVDGGLVRAI